MISKYTDFAQKDISILEFILKHGVVTSKQIQTYMDEHSIYNVYRRLRKLEDAKLVFKKKLTKHLNVYFPQREARDFLDYPVTVTNDTSLYLAQHDLLLNDLVLFLKKSFKLDHFEYKTEREFRFEEFEDVESNKEMIKKWNEIRNKLPDVVIYIEEKAVAIELELHAKSAKRLKEKLTIYGKYLLEGKYNQVWYYYPNHSVKNAVERALKSLDKMAQEKGGKFIDHQGRNWIERFKMREIPEEVMKGDE